MFAYDVDGDGLSDIVTSLDAHGWGLSWFKQVKGPSGEIAFQENEIMPKSGPVAGRPRGVQFSQVHAVSLADMDGDGLKDIVTGKCYRAHGFAAGFPDPAVREPAVLYWFRLTRTTAKGNKAGKAAKVRFVPHLIDDDSGVGRQLVTGDIDGDGRLDVVTGNRKGSFVFLQQPAGSRPEQASLTNAAPRQ
jgi:hypothetical protein